ncbi:MAG TPA: SDR family NAD(P)-dependent oxidoreductase [Myxococcales bacterium]|nr:SDR family NAD(P)-dependent oxidoreductase [Myxococcales bacterium]
MPPISDAGPILARPILGLTPFEHPDSALCIALSRAGAIGVLDLGRDPRASRNALAAVSAQVPGEFGVRIPEGLSVEPWALPESTALVLLPATAGLAAFAPFRPTLVQVTSLEEARAARDGGAAGLVAKGSESGGRVGEETAFVLLQRIVQEELGLPIWVQGGMGLHGLAAVRAAGARGVLLDSQLALVRESAVPESIKAVLAGMDGSETAVVGGHRVFTRPDLPAAKLTEAVAEDVRGNLGGRDLASQLLPVGQDGALAAPMARRFRTAGGVVRGLTRAADRQIRQAQELAPLAPGSPLAQAHGIRYPIAQGPMTRVSDRAAFALAVAEAGGLPFLALSLLRADEVRRLLEETKSLLGGRTFGVGILGFVPEDLRAEQLAVVEDIGPPVALIAGGRPDQARSLEEKGIETYLHVPSPALLDLFLGDGARRFVFEGRECGGHVGPRSSFVLWEQAVERLLLHPAPEELSILFAGGIHDARSAAMVAAMAAPLAARGARLGVLMGTAYLFTEEAVATGAIAPGFQEEALACERTALLETGPGHATRCVETEYVRDFRAARAKLEAEGLPPAEVWAELERLNLGRLRIAAKGLKREGDKLVAVDAEEQRREGMYMIGQVAAVRSSVVTIEELHRDVSEGSQRLLAALPVAPLLTGESHPVDVAVIGMACVLPGAPDLKTYWANVVGGVDAITEVPRARWNPDLYFDPDSNDGERTPSKWGGFLADVPFDPLSFGLPPKSLGSIDPAQLLSLEVARRALADAGYLEREFDRERTSVIFGAEAGTDLSTAYGFRALYPQLLGPLPDKLREHLPTLSEDSFAGVLSNVISGRIANRLDLGGVNYTVDAACASSLAALDLAVKELVGGSSEMVLCGAADLHNGINDYLMFASVHALSRKGRCATFDSEADGIVLGEGVACVVLKRLADAERDGDRIYAVLRGVAGSSDGRSLGLTAPRKEGQMRALERAYRQSGVSPAEVGLVEAHGTGTVVGDRTELASLTEVFSRAGAAVGATALGSVKSQIGHTKCCAGLAGLIKASLALCHRVLPPTLHVKAPNPAWERAQSPFVLQTGARPWLPPESGGTRKAAVSAFGFGGTNFHAVLAEYPREEPPASGGERFPCELFLFRGATPAEAAERAGALLARLTPTVTASLADLAFTAFGDGKGQVQVALVAQGVEDLRRKLARAKELAAGDGVFLSHAPAGQLAFLFPGQGSQRPGMLGDLFVAFPALQRLLELGRPWAGRILPATAFGEAEREAQAAALTDTRVAQPALGVVELAALELLSSLGVTPDMAGGHSYGELTALCAAGAMSQEDLLAISQARAECILAAAGAEPGTMAAVSAPLARVRELCEGTGTTLVNENSDSQGVIAGSRAAVEAALEKLAQHGVSAQRLQVACAFHSPLLAGADAAFARRLAAMDLRAPGLPVFSNVTAAPYAPSPDDVRRLLARQLVSPVRFKDQVEAMYAAGARVFVEAGPGQVLTRLVGRILGERPHVAVAIARDGQPGLEQLLTALAELAVHGVPVQLAPLFAGRQVKRVDFKAAPVSPSLWLVNGQLARPAGGEIPAGALRPNEEPIAVLAPAAAAGSEREGTVLTFLQSMQQLADAQREVMLRYLGAPPEAAQTLERTHTAPRAAAPARVAEAPAPTVGVALEDGRPPDIAELLLALVSERTGYPAEMLNLDADLEAELSIDSIKRVEILGALTQRLGLGKGNGGAGDLALEKLAAVKTLRGIASWIETRMGGEAPKVAAAPPPVKALAEATTLRAAAPALYWAERRWAERAPPTAASLAGRSYWIVPDDRGVAGLLAAALRGRGAMAVVQREAPGRCDGLVDLAGLGRSDLWGTFERCRAAMAAGAGELIAASGLGGLGGAGAAFTSEGDLAGAGLAGLLASLWHERPSLRVRAVDVDAAEEAAKVASSLAAELGADAAETESAWKRGVRRVPVIAEAAPAGAGLALNEKSVVLLTGGARGITARLAVALARRFRCRLELVGRRELPAQEAPELRGAGDLVSLRKALLAGGKTRGLAEIEAEAQAIVAGREARGTLAAIEAAGGQAVYHAVDVRTPAAVSGLLAELYARQGRLDAVFHGAGITDDRAFESKQREGFDRVVATKLGGALSLLRHLRPDLKLLAFFGSVSGVFGNRGQADYAAANDALDRLAWALSDRFAGPVVSLDFGPWAGAGMVGPELVRTYEERGVPLIPLEAGVAAVLDALFGGAGNGHAARLPPQLMLAAAPLSAFAAKGAPEADARRSDGPSNDAPHVLAS